MHRLVGKWLNFQSRRGLGSVPGFSNFLLDYAGNERNAIETFKDLQFNDEATFKSKTLLRKDLQNDLDKEG